MRGLALAASVLLAASCEAPVEPQRSQQGSELEGQSRVRACLRRWPEHCSAQDAGCQGEVFATVRCLTGAPADVVAARVRVVPAAHFPSELKRLGRLPDADSPLRQRALELLGLVSRKDSDEAPSSASVPAGFYSYASREIVLPDAASDAVVLAHEYVHSLQDRGGEIGKAALSWTTLDENLARRASLEGEAICVEHLIRARHGGHASVTCGERNRRRFEGSRCRSTVGAAALAGAQGCFVYPHGAASVARHQQPLSLLPVDFHLAEARGFTQVLMGENLGFESLPAPPPAGPPRLGTSDLVSSERVGGWLTRQFMAGLGRLRDAPEIAEREYLGDWLGIYASAPDIAGAAPSVTGALWSIRWSSDAGALRAERFLRSLPGPSAATCTVHRAGAVTELRCLH